MVVKKVNHIIYTYSVLCIILSLIIAWTNVSYFEVELEEYDEKVFSKIEKLSSSFSEINNYMYQVENIILEGDVAILYDYENREVIDSINVVVGEQFEKQVHKSIELNEKRIRLDRDMVEINQTTYIQNLDLKIKNIYYVEFEEGYILYYIPKIIIRNNYMLIRLLSAFSTSCFFVAVTMWFFEKKKDLKN